MADDIVLQSFFEALIDGDRARARVIIQDRQGQGVSPAEMITELFWPAYELVDRMHREDRLTNLSANIATRLLRVLLDRNAAEATNQARDGRSIFAACGPTETDEMGAQMAVDLIEATGNPVVFAGGGVATEEILERVHETRPDVLLLFCVAPSDLPHIRQLIDRLHEIGACPNTQIVVGGGVFNRAEGLAEEIGADLWAEDPLEVVELVTYEAEHRAPADQRTVGRTRRTRTAA
ncbi:MAG: cobalamin-dependent protein [Planctomycetota bacterium]